MKLYESMILLENNFAREDFEKAVESISKVITENGGEVVNCVKWDERKLAYEIEKQKRGTYVLMHFNAPTASVAKIEKDYRLVAGVLRVLIVVDKDGVEAPEATMPANVMASY